MDGLAAGFDGAVRLSVADTGQNLTWINTAPALSVSCWVKFVLPSDATITQNMVIVADRNSGTWNASNQIAETHSYALYLNAQTGNIEFSSRGPGGYFSKILVEKPFLERWYHLAIVRSGSSINGYVDARRMFSDAISVGDSKSTDGVSIGGLGTANFLRGEILEVQVFRAALSQTQISANRFLDLNPATWSTLKGYYKLGFVANPADQFKNSATSPAAGTDPATKSGTGIITFEATNRDGEQSLFDSTKNGGNDAVTPLSGGFDWDQEVISRPTPGVPFDFSISYSSGNAFNKAPLEEFDAFQPAALGVGWRHNFEIRVLPNTSFNPNGSTQALGLMVADGNIETWDFLSASGDTTKFKTRHKEYRGELEFVGSPFDPEAIVRWTTPERLLYIFRSPHASNGDALTLGRLKEIRDLNGNRLLVSIHELGEKAGLVDTVTDTSGGVWTFIYNAQNLLTSVTGLGWTVNFTYDASNRLATRSLAGPAAYEVPTSTTWQFQYGTGTPAGLLEIIRNPRGKQEIRVAYDKYGRKTTAWDGVGRITTFQYNVPVLRQLTTTAQFGGAPDPAKDRKSIQTFDRKLRLLSVKDPLGYMNSLAYDEAGNVTTATDAIGNRTTMTYDDRSNMLSKTDPLGQMTRWEYAHVLSGGIPHNEPTKDIRPSTEEAPAGWENRYTYDPAGNLLAHKDDLGTLAEHTYNPSGLVTSSKDGNGNETRFGYDANGFRNSVTAAFGTPQAATATSTLSELGWPLSATTPLNETTTMTYDLNGRVVRSVDPIDRVLSRKYDASGNLEEETDGNGAVTRHVYNDNDERTRTTDRLGKVWDYSYTAFGEPYQTTGPAVLSDGTTQRDTVTNAYDANGRLVRVTDPYGDFSAFEYDANDNQTAVIDKLGKRWEKTYDALDRVVAEKDPEGNVRATHYDTAGRVKVVVSPNGNPSTHAYDGRSRLKTWTDPEGYRWIYTYDGVGNILDIEDALSGHYLMSYGPRNERLTELNQDNKSWAYTYDALARLKTHSDPNGTVRTMDYDAVGRLRSVEFSTGRINSLSYDNNNNVVAVARTKPGNPTTTLNLVYDPMDRLVETRDTYSKTVRYAYDDLGRVRAKTYPAGKVLTHTYDRLGRLKGLSFAFSASQTYACAFEYDKAGRMTGRTYPNGIRQTNAFDSAGRLSTMDYKSSGGESLIALSYAYDRNGNKTGGGEKGTLDWQAASVADYDETSRFTSAGRLIDRTDAASAMPKVMSYTYDESGNMVRATAPGQSYDLAYDEDNRTTSILWQHGLGSRAIVNRYDALGRRIARTSDGVETQFVLDLVGGMERILCDTDAAGVTSAWYVHGPDLCFKVDQAGQVTCYHSDAMANVVRTTDSAASTVNQYAYSPYGRSLDTSDSAPVADPYRFVGSQGVMLELPGLYFMRARYYSTDAAVFLATDPVKNIGPGWKPDAYGYALGNPLTYVDADGRFAHIAALTIGGAIKGLITESVSLGVDAITGGDLDWNDVGSRLVGAAAGGAVSGLLASVGIVGPAASAAGGFVDNMVRGAVDNDEKMSIGASLSEAGKSAAFSWVGDKYLPKIGGNKMTKISSVVAGVRGQMDILTSTIETSVSKSVNALTQMTSSVTAGSQKQGGSSRSSSLSNKTTDAASRANGLNAKQSTKPSPPTITSKSSGSSSSSKMVQAIKSAASTVKSFVKDVVSSTKKVATNFISKISSIFKRRK